METLFLTISKWIIVVFGLFFISAASLMFFAPQKATQILRKAGSTNFINYAEITIRMIPATGLILFSNYSKFPELFKIFGWFMITTSLVLYFIPRKVHHGFSLRCAEMIKPLYFQLISPFSLLIGLLLIYSVI